MKRIASAITVSVLLVACSDAVGIHPEESFTVSPAVSHGDIVDFLVITGEHAIQGGTGQSTVTAGRTIGTNAVPECTGNAREYPIQEALVHNPLPPGTKLGSLSGPSLCIGTDRNITYDVFLAIVF